jgi:hypothetical protein
MLLLNHFRIGLFNHKTEEMRLLLSLLCLTGMAVQAQKMISLTPEPIAVAGQYHFRNIEIRDSRIDTTILGRVVKGTFGLAESLAPLKLKEPNAEAFRSFFEGCTATVEKGSQDILMNITDIFVDEDPASGAFGTVDIRAEIYAIKEGKYYPVYTYEQSEVLTAFDVTKKLIRGLNTGLKNILEYSNNFFTTAVFDKPALTEEEALNVRYAERKKKFPAYSEEKVQDGIYGTFDEFMENKPGRPINMLTELMIKNLDKPKRKREVIFGYCYNGQMAIFQDVKYDTSHVYKRGNDFYMQNYGIDHSKEGAQNALLWFTNAALLMNTESWYEYVLNPRTGNWYQMTKLGNKKRKTEETPAEDQATSSN